MKKILHTGWEIDRKILIRELEKHTGLSNYKLECIVKVHIIVAAMFHKTSSQNNMIIFSKANPNSKAYLRHYFKYTKHGKTTLVAKIDIDGKDHYLNLTGAYIPLELKKNVCAGVYGKPIEVPRIELDVRKYTTTKD